MARSIRIALAALSAVVVSAQNSWSIIKQNIGTFSTGIAFNADGQTGFVAVGANGVGAMIYKTINGGKTWKKTSDAFELMVLDVTSDGQYVATMGALSAEYSQDGGSTFNDSTVSGVGIGAGQCIRNLGAHDDPDGFVMVGQFGLFTSDNGIAISTDGGATYTPFNVTQLVTGTRYGAFPTNQTFYVNGGQWPGEGSDDSSGSGSGSSSSSSSATFKQITARTGVTMTKNGPRYTFQQPTFSGRSTQGTNGSYVAQIVKSSDGGNTWSSVFLRNNWAYFNGMDCLDENRCCAGAENDDENGFAAIVCTTDGGQTWTQNYYSNQTGASILDLRVVGTDGYWAVGGAVAQDGSAAGFLYSGDAGATWTLDTVITNQYATSVDCAQGTQECWATLIDVDTQAASIAYASTV